MMRWNEPLTLKVQILSPIAIGAGEKCNTLGFVTDKNKVLVVDEKALIAALNKRQQEMFLQWLEPLVETLAHLRERERKARDNQALLRQLRQQRRETEHKIALIAFLREILQMSQPVQWLRQVKAIRYEVSAVSVPARYEGFSFCLKTPDHRPYIAGSELKGAIRTAALNALFVQNANLLTILQSQLQNLSGNHRQLHNQLSDLWQRMEQDLVRAGKKDAHYDFFRGIAVSDSEPLPTNSLRIYAAKRLGMSRDVTVFVEAIAPKSETTFTLSIAKPDRWLQAMGLTNKSGWLDWGKLSETLYEHANSVLDFIAGKLSQINRQTQRPQQNRIAQNLSQIQERVQALKQQNQPNSPLVCIGWGQGYLSVTMTDPLRKRYPQSYEALRRLMAQAINQYGRTKPNDFPKTIWVALDGNNQPVDLFGWLKLEAMMK